MSTVERVLSHDLAPTPFQSALGTLAREVSALASALLQPGKVLREVEQMGKLLAAANSLEQHAPDQALALRRRAAAMGRN